MRYAMIGAALAATVLAAPAGAQEVTSTDPEAMAALLVQEGYRAKIETDNVGDPVIRSAAGGANFSIYFYGCEGGKDCTSIQFYTGWSTDTQFPLERMNQWNIDKRFSRGIVDEEGDPTLRFDLNLDMGGMSRELFLDNFSVWLSLMDSFEDFIDTQ